ncbi:MAG TPA: hypothetical protein VFW59_03365 [Gallionella sp.]|nr:hypothetical protein [Gallionella sp.]
MSEPYGWFFIRGSPFVYKFVFRVMRGASRRVNRCDQYGYPGSYAATRERQTALEEDALLAQSEYGCGAARGMMRALSVMPIR